jgi:hypothetical protein
MDAKVHGPFGQNTRQEFFIKFIKEKIIAVILDSKPQRNATIKTLEQK